MARRGRVPAGSSARIDPARYSPRTSQSRGASLRFAWAGFGYMLRYQKNTRIMLAAAVIAVALALWLGLAADHCAILILAIGGVWLAEFINAAIEATVNLSAPDIQPMAKVAKDVAAGATLVAVVVAVLVGCLLLLPPLTERLLAGGA